MDFESFRLKNFKKNSQCNTKFSVSGRESLKVFAIETGIKNTENRTVTGETCI